LFRRAILGRRPFEPASILAAMQGRRPARGGQRTAAEPEPDRGDRPGAVAGSGGPGKRLKWHGPSDYIGA